MDVSVVILTLNEEKNLPTCLQSVSWCDDIVVFDSFSTDNTVTMATQAGARLFERGFDNYAAQRNAAIHNVQYKHPWILMIDADECVSPALKVEIETVLATESEGITLYRMRRKDMFLGRWLQHSSGYPTWFGRLFRPDQVRVERHINEEFHTDGDIGYLNEHLIHRPFNKGLGYWFERHNRYAAMEARTLAREKTETLSLQRLFHPDPVIRRQSFKQWAYRLPGRPFLIFCYLYFVRRGFLDGQAGLTFCKLRQIYESMIDAMLRVHHTNGKRHIHAHTQSDITKKAA